MSEFEIYETDDEHAHEEAESDYPAALWMTAGYYVGLLLMLELFGMQSIWLHMAAFFVVVMSYALSDAFGRLWWLLFVVVMAAEVALFVCANTV